MRPRKCELTLLLCLPCTALLAHAAAAQVSWVKARGKEGKVVYIFGLKRRTGQAASLSKPVRRSSSRCSSSRDMCRHTWLNWMS
jgi:hypothetical protein